MAISCRRIRKIPSEVSSEKFTSSVEEAPSHPFGGCNRTLNHYQIIGAQLLQCERRKGTDRWGSGRVLREFQEGVAFVPVEVLESYLEDLLDLEASNESLFIRPVGILSRCSCLSVFGLIGSLSCGVLSFVFGNTITNALLMTGIVVVPFAILWFISPYSGLIRRLNFAQIVSQEVSRRRGRGKDPRDWSTRQYVLGKLHVFDKFLPPRDGEAPEGAAARVFCLRPKNS